MVALFGDVSNMMTQIAELQGQAARVASLEVEVSALKNRVETLEEASSTRGPMDTIPVVAPKSPQAVPGCEAALASPPPRPARGVPDPLSGNDPWAATLQQAGRTVGASSNPKAAETTPAVVPAETPGSTPSPLLVKAPPKALQKAQSEGGTSPPVKALPTKARPVLPSEGSAPEQASTAQLVVKQPPPAISAQRSTTAEGSAMAEAPPQPKVKQPPPNIQALRSTDSASQVEGSFRESGASQLFVKQPPPILRAQLSAEAAVPSGASAVLSQSAQSNGVALDSAHSPPPPPGDVDVQPPAPLMVKQPPMNLVR